MTLDKIQINTTYIIEKVESRRLMEMGFSSGKKIKKIKAGIFKDPLLIKVGNSYISIRRKEAKLIKIKESNEF